MSILEREHLAVRELRPMADLIIDKAYQLKRPEEVEDEG